MEGLSPWRNQPEIGRPGLHPSTSKVAKEPIETKPTGDQITLNQTTGTDTTSDLTAATMRKLAATSSDRPLFTDDWSRQFTNGPGHSNTLTTLSGDHVASIQHQKTLFAPDGSGGAHGNLEDIGWNLSDGGNIR